MTRKRGEGSRLSNLCLSRHRGSRPGTFRDEVLHGSAIEEFLKVEFAQVNDFLLTSRKPNTAKSAEMVLSIKQ